MDGNLNKKTEKNQTEMLLASLVKNKIHKISKLKITLKK